MLLQPQAQECTDSYGRHRTEKLSLAYGNWQLTERVSPDGFAGALAEWAGYERIQPDFWLEYNGERHADTRSTVRAFASRGQTSAFSSRRKPGHEPGQGSRFLRSIIRELS